MTFRNTEYHIFTSHDEEGVEQFAHASIKRVQISEDGVAFPATPIDVTQQSELGPALAGFNADVLASRNSLTAQLAGAQANHASQVETLNSTHAAAITALNQQIATLQTQLSTAQAEAANNANAASQLAVVTTQVSTLTTEKSALETRVTALIGQLPFDPRKITVPAFMERLTREELLMLTDVDPTTAQIAAMLREWKTNDWPIFLDQDKSPEFAMAMGYFMQTGRLTPERVAQITVDSTRAEAPIPTT
jgi:hypothetical protein